MNIGVQEAPRSFGEPREGVHVHVERPPDECIAYIEPNEEAVRVLPDSLTFLGSREYLREHIACSVPEGDRTHSVLTPDTWGRAVPRAYGVIPFAGMVGRVLSGKGAWCSGNLLKKYDLFGGKTHYGLLSRAGALWDIGLSNVLIRNGFRSALHLGHAVFNEERLASWLVSRWSLHDLYSKQIPVMFERLARSGNGPPAYLFRIAGTLERFDTNLFESDGAPRRQKAEVAVAARLMLQEARMESSFIGSCMSVLRADVGQKALESLESLRQRKPLDASLSAGYNQLLCAIAARNAVAVYKSSREFGDYRFNAGKVSKAKDIDMAWFSLDFDEADDPEVPCNFPKSAEQNMEKYIFRAVTEIDWYQVRILDEYGLTERPLRSLFIEQDIRTYVASFLH